jgi:hypothetical protein
MVVPLVPSNAANLTSIFSTEARDRACPVTVRFPLTFLKPVPKNNPEKLRPVGIILILPPIPVIAGKLKPVSRGTATCGVFDISILEPIVLKLGTSIDLSESILCGKKLPPTVVNCGSAMPVTPVSEIGLND